MDHVVAQDKDLAEGGALRCSVGGKDVALFRRNGELYAIDAVCPHRKGPLDEGAVEDGLIVVCPWHGWRFDLRDGSSPTHPGRVRCYRVRVEDGSILIES
ncbi:Rieske (2Fe-2S) protein [Candidatus Sumerlaeota bacterium]|nr:Rieske (2Fe-2S) protein [Candidatus Sumerlaeota bacterium]